MCKAAPAPVTPCGRPPTAEPQECPQRCLQRMPNMDAVNFEKEHPMKYAYLMRTAIVAATLGAGCVLAQTDAPVVTDFARTAAPVVSDAAPDPAEERSSTGAIVLQ